jgi:hypothetical protein
MSLAMTDSAGIIRIRSAKERLALAKKGMIASGQPTKRRFNSELEASACNEAGTVTGGPKSPPIASNARVRRIKVSPCQHL